MTFPLQNHVKLFLLHIINKFADQLHLHSGINFVTPASKHCGSDEKILKKRHEIYEQAKLRNPNRWSGKTRNWSAVTIVNLNPKKASQKGEYQIAA